MTRRLIRGATGAALPLLLPTAVRAAEEGGSAVFSLDLGLVIWTWVLFLLTLGILAWKVFPWISGGLEERRRRIQEAIDEAQSERDEARRQLEDAREQLAEARREAQRIIDEGREAGERLRGEIVEEAREEGERMLARARRELQRERDRLADELRREVVEISIAAAEKLIRERLDSEQNRRLVREYVSQLG